MRWAGPFIPRFECGHPLVLFEPDGINVILKSELRFRDSFGRLWVALSGKRSDGASIPRILWPWLGGPYNGFHRDGALLHDDAGYCNASPDESTWWSADRSPERKLADNMIWEATVIRVEAAGLGWFKRRHEIAKANAIYEGLRIGGCWAWRDHARRNAKEISGRN